MQDHFATKAAKPAFLRHTDPPVCTVTYGTSPIILTGHHNGWHVPQALHRDGKPLGVEAFWFDPDAINHRHEACDWGVAALLGRLSRQLPHAYTIASNYSRLVCDKNRTRDHTITPASTEYEDQPIPGNQDLSPEQLAQRHEIYDAYIQELESLIRHVQTQHGGAIILDLHSFSPTWKGIPRPRSIGAIALETNNPLSAHTNAFLRQQAGNIFSPDYPYNMSTHEHAGLRATLLGNALREEFNVQPVILEFRNDVLQDKITLPHITGLIKNLILDIQNSPNLGMLMNNDAPSEPEPHTP